MTNQQIISARRDLFARGARLPLALAGLLPALLVMILMRGMIAILTLIERLCGIEIWLSELGELALLLGLPLLLALPLLCGVIPLAWRMCCRSAEPELECTSNADMVCIFGPLRILPRSWLIILLRALPLLLAVGGVIGLVQLWSYVDGFAIIGGSVAVSLAVHAAMIVALLLIELLAVMLAVRTYLLPAYALRGDMRLGCALSCAWRASRGQALRIIGFALRYLGWALLGLLSLGVLLVLRVIPCYYIEYNIFADELLKGTEK